MNKSLVLSLFLFSLSFCMLTMPTATAIKTEQQGPTWKEKFKSGLASAKSATWSATKNFSKDTLSLSVRILRRTAVTAGAIGISYLAVMGTLLILRQTTGIYLPITPSELATLFKNTIPTAINNATKSVGANAVRGAFDELNKQLSKELVVPQTTTVGKQTLLSFIGQQATQGASEEIKKQLPGILSQVQATTTQTITNAATTANIFVEQLHQHHIPQALAAAFNQTEACNRLKKTAFSFWNWNTWTLANALGIRQTSEQLLSCTEIKP